MTKVANLAVDVNVRMHVSDETAKTALRLIDIWLNEDFNRDIIQRTNEDGTVKHSLFCASTGKVTATAQGRGEEETCTK